MAMNTNAEHDGEPDIEKIEMKVLIKNEVLDEAEINFSSLLENPIKLEYINVKTITDATTNYEEEVESIKRKTEETDVKEETDRECEPTNIFSKKKEDEFGITRTSLRKEATFHCKLCKYVGFRIKNLQIHMQRHNKEKQFKCNLCNLSFVMRDYLFQHLKTHSQEKPYKCDHCSYAANRKRLLTNHMWSHSDNKPFECNMCNYKTQRKNDLVVHMRYHTGEKPYKCDQCDFCCATNSILTRHKKTHVKKVPM